MEFNATFNNYASIEQTVLHYQIHVSNNLHNILLLINNWGRRGRDRMAIGFTPKVVSSNHVHGEGKGRFDRSVRLLQAKNILGWPHVPCINHFVSQFVSNMSQFQCYFPEEIILCY
jgi:hypothetical protein